MLLLHRTGQHYLAPVPNPSFDRWVRSVPGAERINIIRYIELNPGSGPSSVPGTAVCLDILVCVFSVPLNSHQA